MMVTNLDKNNLYKWFTGVKIKGIKKTRPDDVSGLAVTNEFQRPLKREKT
jgi:hypothetical protein